MTGEATPSARSSRAYPERPIVGIGAILVIDDGVVLVRRKHAPSAGQWSLPGGAVELGETLKQAVRREVREETGLEVEVGPLVAIVDRIRRDGRGRIQYHFVLNDYLCRPSGGTLEAGSDASDIAVVRLEELAAYGVAPATRQVIARGLEMAASEVESP
jgi:mutator protein MutT